MRHIAIVGSGPAGYYTAEACIKLWGAEVSVDIIDRLPVPYGLIRTGVAPDHQSIKAVSRRYEGVAIADNVHFVGNVTIGIDVSIAELTALYDAVVLATGAPADKPLGIPGEDLPGVIGSAAFVGWYNGHPEHAGLKPSLDVAAAAVIGNGNVALDVARILAKAPHEFDGSDIVGHAFDALGVSSIDTVTLVGRRGPHQIAMTPKELGELGHLHRAAPLVDPADLPPAADDATLDPGVRKSVALIRGFAAREPRPDAIGIVFDFFAQPIAIEGDGRAERLIVERTRLDGDRAVGTGERYAIPCGLVVACIGYRTSPIPDVPFDAALGRFANTDGRIADGLYCVGWARRGPTGTIGTNRPDGFAIVERIAADRPSPGGRQGRSGLDALLARRQIAIVTFRDWQKIEREEIARARTGSPREKFVDVAAMLAARDA